MKSQTTLKTDPRSGRITGFLVDLDHDGGLQVLVDIALPQSEAGDKTAILVRELRRLVGDLQKVCESPSETTWDTRSPIAK